MAAPSALRPGLVGVALTDSSATADPPFALTRRTVVRTV